jgi:hypothetical protein
MGRREYRRRAGLLAAGLLVATAYIAVLSQAHTLTGHPLMDGVLGITGGLYLCSCPAANAIDFLFYRDYFHQPTSGWAGLGWLSLNALAMTMGWLMITSGITHVIAQH